jgi:hypothetical protein
VATLFHFVDPLPMFTGFPARRHQFFRGWIKIHGLVQLGTGVQRDVVVVPRTFDADFTVDFFNVTHRQRAPHVVANRINAIKLRSSLDHRDETSIEFGVDSRPLLLEGMIVDCDLMPLVGVLRDGGKKPILESLHFQVQKGGKSS